MAERRLLLRVGDLVYLDGGQGLVEYLGLGGEPNTCTGKPAFSTNGDFVEFPRARVLKVYHLAWKRPPGTQVPGRAQGVTTAGENYVTGSHTRDHPWTH